MRYFLHIAYDGTKYRGWQRQPEAKSVQEAIESKLEKIFKKKTPVHGCGRTDAGVHASQYFLNINLPEPLTFDLKFRLNKNLPDDIAVYDVIEGKEKQHARFDAIARTYDYFIHFQKDPVLDQYSSCYDIEKLDFKAMQKAAKLLEKGHDFRQFCKQPDLHNHTLCEIQHAELHINAQESRLHFTMTANRFLRGMMRITVAYLVEIGLQRITLEEFENKLNCTAQESEIIPAPPNGLFLSKVNYPYLNLPESESVCAMMKLGF